MANWARGLASGLETGVRIGDLLEQKRQREALAREAAKYTPTEGAYGPALQENIQQVRGLQEQAIAGGMDPEEAARQYGPSIAELERRAGLTAPDYSVGTQTFGTREEAMRAAAPMRAQGLANVYRQFGDIERADAAEARAQQAEAAGLQIGAARRREAEEIAALARQKEDAKWWQSRLTDAEGNARAPTTEDFLAASQRNAQSLIGAGKLNEAGAAFREFMTTARGQIELQGAERTEAIRKAAAALQAGDLKPAEEFYKKFVPNGANVKDFSVDAKGNIKINQVDLDGKPLPPTTLTRDQLLQGLVSFNDPAKLVEYTQQSFMNNLREQQLKMEARKTDAAVRASDVTTALRGEQLTNLRNQQAGNAEAARIREQYMGLTPEEQTGPLGQGLIRQFNMANIKAGATVPLGPAARPERDKDQEAWLKTEQGLIRDGLSSEEISTARDQFFARRGYAPQLLLRVIESGIDPTTNKPLTMQQVEDFNRKYPQSRVNPAELPWVQREITRQGLINQIPR